MKLERLLDMLEFLRVKLVEYKLNIQKSIVFLYKRSNKYKELEFKKNCARHIHRKL